MERALTLEFRFGEDGHFGEHGSHLLTSRKSHEATTSECSDTIGFNDGLGDIQLLQQKHQSMLTSNSIPKSHLLMEKFWKRKMRGTRLATTIGSAERCFNNERLCLVVVSDCQ